METMNNDQLLELLKIGDIKGFNEYRKENPDQYIDFKRADLAWADLRGGDLSGVDLTWANFQDADLRGADLTWANFQDANLQGASLNGAELMGADLRGANLLKADLCWSNLFEVKINPGQKDMIINALGITVE